MKTIKTITAITLVTSLIVGGITPSLTNAAEKTNAQLKKEISTLKSTIKKKDATIKAKDKIIASYKGKYILKSSSTKLLYNGTLTEPKFKYRNKTVPSVLNYNNVLYAPVPMLTKMVGIPYALNSTGGLGYLGIQPDGEFMMDYDEYLPYFIDNGTWYTNYDMYMGNRKYNKGLSINANGNSNLSINLEGKYTKINCLLGLDDTANNSDVKVKILDEEENILYQGTLIAGQLPEEIELDVKGVKSLHINVNGGFTYQVDFANLIIK